MENFRFADALMILLVCGIIYAILYLVNRPAGKKKSVAGSTTCETDLSEEKLSEDN